MRKFTKIGILLLILSIFLINQNSLMAASETEVKNETSVTKQIENKEEKPDLSGQLISRIIIYLMLIVSIGFVIVYFFKQGKFMQGIRKQGKLLKVSETHVLGNKQFLVVVEYGKQKVLLGVGPNMINHLCFLDNIEESPKTQNIVSKG
ncbi:MAG: hypothetical protein C5B43_03435 [Verrucomicrobia bacterium]|nr:MAG: hypothetical protein C5B43_03435 [Verrucomicrobiota bacterium]